MKYIIKLFLIWCILILTSINVYSITESEFNNISDNIIISNNYDGTYTIYNKNDRQIYIESINYKNQKSKYYIESEQKITVSFVYGEGKYTLNSYYASSFDNSIYITIRSDILESGKFDINKALTQKTWYIYPLKYDLIQSNSQKEIASYYNDVVYNNITYDYTKRELVINKPYKYVTYDPITTLKTKKGICGDYAAALVSILRGQNIPCYIAIGNTYFGYHAWVEAYVDGEWRLYDPTNCLEYKLNDTEGSYQKENCY